MGVRGLTTYVNSNKQLLLRRHSLHDTNLVIDGYSLCFQLYITARCLSAFGGDYDRFAAYVKNFLKSLKKCNVSCYVLFDGSLETRKLKTAYSRIRSKIKQAAKVDAVTQSGLHIFPLLLSDVFKQILEEMNIPYTVCEFEADDEIAAMARHLNCPVLSQDSDFYIYNVIYIPLDTVDRNPFPKEQNGTRFYALDCQIYMATHLTESFEGLKEEMLPLFATLLGNDYVKKKEFKNFFSHLKLPKGKGRNEQQRSIHTLLKWLQNETLETAIDKIVGRVKKTAKKRILKIIIKSIEGYTRTHCQSLQYFNVAQDVTSDEKVIMNLKDLSINIGPDDEDDSAKEFNADDNNDDDGSSSDTSESSCDKHFESVIPENQNTELPEWYCDRVRQKIIPQTYMSIYNLKIHLLTPQSEDYTDEDASLSTINFLRYAFDILTDYSQENLVFVSRDNNCHYKRILVGPEHSIARPVEKSYGELSVQELRVYFKHFVEVKFPSLDMSVVESLPSDFHLVMLSILWWVADCSVPNAFIHSLFVTYVMLNVIDEKTGTFRGHKLFNSNMAAKLKELRKRPKAINKDVVLLNKNKVTYEDSLIAASVLLQHFDVSLEIQKRPRIFDTKRMHKFAQFQCILEHFICLNSLSGNPYTKTPISKFLNGTFAYNIAVLLDRQTDPIAFMERYLIGADTVLSFYKSLCQVYDQCAEQLGLSASNSMFVKKKQRKKVHPTFLKNFLESEVFI